MSKSGLPVFRKTITRLRGAADMLRNGGRISGPEDAALLGSAANQFEQALKDRRALMRQLRKLDANNDVLRTITARDS